MRRNRWQQIVAISCLHAIVSAGCGGSGNDTVAPLMLGPPEIVANQSGRAPLAARLRVETDEPTSLRVDVLQPRRALLRSPHIGARHDLAIVGLPSGPHRLELILEDQSGNTTRAQAELELPPLPDGFPPLEILRNEMEDMEPGWTIFATNSGPTSYVMALNAAGEVVWYFHDPDTSLINVELLRNGNLLVSGDHEALEVDVSGDVLHHWVATGPRRETRPPGTIPIETDGLHHEFAEMPEGEEADFLALGIELRGFPDYPADERDPTQRAPSANVAGDLILELRRDGTIVRQTEILDILDPYRVVYDSLSRFWNDLYRQSTADWSHGNAVYLDTADDCYVVSLRGQDAIVKIRRNTGELVWILGSPGRWVEPWDDFLLQPVGEDFRWFFHQHAPEPTSSGTLMLFDNGPPGTLPPAPANPFAPSRALELRIDETAMTVEPVWQYDGGDRPFSSAFLGDADPLPVTGNVLVTDGARDFGVYGRVFEVTRTTPAQIVFEVVVGDADPDNGSWTVYRAERIPPLSPAIAAP